MNQSINQYSQINDVIFPCLTPLVGSYYKYEKAGDSMNNNNSNAFFKEIEKR